MQHHVRRRDRHPLGRERSHGVTQLGETIGFGFDESLVVETFFDDHPQHRGKERHILTRQTLQMQIGLTRGLRSARIDDDQFQTALTRLVQAPGRIERGDTTPHGNQGIGTDQQAYIGLGEILWACAPFAVQRHRDWFARLIDGGIREAHR